MESEIMVSINCITYNQENYIEDAIESFLMQKTNFRYEILLHDDASTDGTAEILRRYEARYPDLIKPIFQTENQFSKGIHISHINMERGKGKYIAYCEGDDFWTDPYKLQKQVDYMESNPDCTLCTHAVEKLDVQTNKVIGVIRPFRESTKCTTEEIIRGGGGFIGTNSLFFPRKLLKTRPEWLLNTLVGDYAMQIYATSEGYAYYIDEVMSVYRVNVKGSWTANTFSSQEKAIENCNRVVAMLHEINRASEHKYDAAILDATKHNMFQIKLIRGEYKTLKGGEFKEIYSALDTNAKISIYIKQHLPHIAQALITIRRKLSI